MTDELYDDTTELARREDQEANIEPVRATRVSLLPVEHMNKALEEYTERRGFFRGWLEKQLVEGLHFGIPPGCEPRKDAAGNYVDKKGRVISPKSWRFKKSLYKAGADFLCDLLMLTPVWENDTETWRMMGEKNTVVCLKCKLINNGSPFFSDRDLGDVLGEGRGAGQAGVKDRDINGAIKIAEKSSKIDAVLTTLGLSDLYGQRDEDGDPDPRQQAATDPTAPKATPRADRDLDPKKLCGALWVEWAPAAAQAFGTDDEPLTQAELQPRWWAWWRSVLGRDVAAWAHLTPDDVKAGEADWRMYHDPRPVDERN